MKHFITLALIALAAFGGTAIANGTTAPERTCYAATTWSGDDSERPCYTVANIEEDSSGRIVIGTASRRQAICVVPNVAEERGTFTVTCQRTQTGGLQTE
jgi:hypothetical protein